MLRITDLLIAYQPLLKKVTISIDDAQCVTIYGASGSGKSLLLRSIADLDKHSGQVFLDNQEQTSFTAPDWRKQVAYITAENYWWFDTIGEHFSDVKNEELLYALDSLGLDRRILDSKVSQCSTGERQRLAILRTMQNKPKVLLLDEPTASLDPESVKRVETYIRNVMTQNNTAVLWVSHDAAQRSRVAQNHFTILDNKLVAADT